MKRVFLLTIIALALATAPAFAEIELGLGATLAPGGGDKTEMLPNLHVGLRSFGIVYGSFDSYILSPRQVEGITGGSLIGRPGMVNTFDLGLGLRLWFLQGSAQVGLNYLRVYKQDELGLDGQGLDFGSNLRLALGLRTRGFGLSASLTSMQQGGAGEAFRLFADMLSKDDAVKGLARQRFIDSAIPSITAIIYL